MSLSRYLAALRQEIERLDTFGFAESIDFREELRAGKQAIVKAEIVLVDGSVLFIREYIDARYKIEKVSYAYQYQDGEGKLIFRYDNAYINRGWVSLSINTPPMASLYRQLCLNYPN